MNTGPSDDPPFADVCDADEVPENGVAAFRTQQRDFLLCNAGGEIFAIADRCTHAAWSLFGSDLDGLEIVCSLHGARFDLRTGEATGRPASKPLRTFQVRIRAGRIEVQVTPPPR